MKSKRPITVPYLVDGMREGLIDRWHVKTGDYVERGQALFDLDVEGQMSEVPSFDDGEVVILDEAGKKCIPGEMVGYVVFTRRTSVWREPLQIELTESQQDQIDKARGDEARGKFLRRMLQAVIDTEFPNANKPCDATGDKPTS